MWLNRAAYFVLEGEKAPGYAMIATWKGMRCVDGGTIIQHKNMTLLDLVTTQSCSASQYWNGTNRSERAQPSSLTSFGTCVQIFTG